jgi:hypothetical protein
VTMILHLGLALLIYGVAVGQARWFLGASVINCC